MKNRGFTIMELLVVMAIIGLFASIGLTQFNVSRERTRDASRFETLHDIRVAVESYNNDHGHYPKEEDGIRGILRSNVSTGAGDALLPYLRRSPKDPLGDDSTTNFFYYDGKFYCDNVDDGAPAAESVVVIHVRMEREENGNALDVCSQAMGDEGVPGPNSFVHDGTIRIDGFPEGEETDRAFMRFLILGNSDG